MARVLREIFSRYSSLVEPLSLDEAYLDVTNNVGGQYAVKIAQSIRETIHKETYFNYNYSYDFVPDWIKDAKVKETLN